MVESQPNTILMIEDDPKIVEAVRMNVSQLNLELDSADDGKVGYEKALSQSYALIILDLMLPGLPGMEVCRKLRENGNTTPIIMLTAMGEELDRIMGLEVGADDYLTKPFSVRELLARIKAQLRRQGWMIEKENDEESSLKRGRLSIDLLARVANLDGEVVELTATEFELLIFLANHPGRTFTRTELLEGIWKTSLAEYSKSVNTLINRVRNKIERVPAEPKFIRTVRGYGYRFAKPEEYADA